MIEPILMCVQVYYLVERCNQVQKCVLHDYLFLLWLNLCIGHYSFSHRWTWYLSCRNNRCRPKPSRCLLSFVVKLLALSLFLCHENNIGTHQDHPSWIFFHLKIVPFSIPFSNALFLLQSETSCFVVNEGFFLTFSLLIFLQDSRTRRTLETLALTLHFSIICFVASWKLHAKLLAYHDRITMTAISTFLFAIIFNIF